MDVSVYGVRRRLRPDHKRRRFESCALFDGEFFDGLAARAEIEGRTAVEDNARIRGNIRILPFAEGETTVRECQIAREPVALLIVLED